MSATGHGYDELPGVSDPLRQKGRQETRLNNRETDWALSINSAGPATTAQETRDDPSSGPASLIDRATYADMCRDTYRKPCNAYRATMSRRSADASS